MTIFMIIVLILFGYVIINNILDSKAPIEKIEAKLIKKGIDNTIDTNNIINVNYVLVFKIPMGKKSFFVKYSEYEKFNQNDEGELVFKRNRFVDFIVKI